MLLLLVEHDPTRCANYFSSLYLHDCTCENILLEVLHAIEMFDMPRIPRYLAEQLDDWPFLQYAIAAKAGDMDLAVDMSRRLVGCPCKLEDVPRPARTLLEQCPTYFAYLQAMWNRKQHLLDEFHKYIREGYTMRPSKRPGTSATSIRGGVRDLTRKTTIRTAPASRKGSRTIPIYSAQRPVDKSYVIPWSAGSTPAPVLWSLFSNSQRRNGGTAYRLSSALTATFRRPRRSGSMRSPRDRATRITMMQMKAMGMAGRTMSWTITPNGMRLCSETISFSSCWFN